MRIAISVHPGAFLMLLIVYITLLLRIIGAVILVCCHRRKRQPSRKSVPPILPVTFHLGGMVTQFLYEELVV
ncbi:hypothetical protein C2S51_029760, partial [Perilla frutescens var. frutescens]